MPQTTNTRQISVEEEETSVAVFSESSYRKKNQIWVLKNGKDLSREKKSHPRHDNDMNKSQRWESTNRNQKNEVGIAKSRNKWPQQEVRLDQIIRWFEKQAILI